MTRLALDDEDSTGRVAPGRRRWLRSRRSELAPTVEPTVLDAAAEFNLDMAPNDPLIAFCQQTGGAIDIESLELDSRALSQPKSAGAKLGRPGFGPYRPSRRREPHD